MRTIKISDAVWDRVVSDGKFGETADDVLRRLLSVGGSPNEKPAPARGWKERRATKTMTQDVEHNELVLRFESGETFREPLPPKDNPAQIRRIRTAAVEFVKRNGGTKGQEHAAIRALTSNGYHVNPRLVRNATEYV